MLPSPSLRANYAVRLKASVEGKTERKDEEREREEGTGGGGEGEGGRCGGGNRPNLHN